MPLDYQTLDLLRRQHPAWRLLAAEHAHWGHEGLAQQRDLPRLTAHERAVYDSLHDNRIRPGLRLEQERIGFGWVCQALAAL